MNQLNLSVIGHTNTGKTSLLRTLTHDSRLGQVSDQSGTTRHVEAITFHLNSDHEIIFYDTPGFEDSINLFDYLVRINKKYPKEDGVDKLSRFLSSPEAEHRFEQEAKIIRQLLKTDLALYVIDVREAVLEKYHDELTIIAMSNKPILAILNFTAQNSPYEEEWRTILSRVGIHTMINFDAAFPSIGGEMRLYQSLSLLLESSKTTLDLWQQLILDQTQERSKLAKKLIAEALIDVTAYVEVVEDKDEIEKIVAKMQQKVRERESKVIEKLIALYKFEASVNDENDSPIIETSFDQDLFNAEALKIMGIQVSKGVVSGAMVGAGIDLVAGGALLGTASLVGATIGGLAETFRHYGKRVKDYFKGYSKMSVDDAIICFLSLRLIQFNQQLMSRAHGNTELIQMSSLDEEIWKKGKLLPSLKKARVHPEWSSLNTKFAIKKVDQNKKEAISHVVSEMESI